MIKKVCPSTSVIGTVAHVIVQRCKVKDWTPKAKWYPVSNYGYQKNEFQLGLMVAWHKGSWNSGRFKTNTLGLASLTMELGTFSTKKTKTVSFPDRLVVWLYLQFLTVYPNHSPCGSERLLLGSIPCWSIGGKLACGVPWNRIWKRLSKSTVKESNDPILSASQTHKSGQCNTIQ